MKNKNVDKTREHKENISFAHDSSVAIALKIKQGRVTEEVLVVDG